MPKSKQKMIVVNERPAQIDCYPVMGEHIDITKCTLFVRFRGSFVAVPEAVATQFRPDEELAVGFANPNRHGLETAIIPADQVPEVFYQTVEPDAKFD